MIFLFLGYKFPKPVDCILSILRVPHSKRTKESLILSVILSEKEMCEQATG